MSSRQVGDQTAEAWHQFVTAVMRGGHGMGGRSRQVGGMAGQRIPAAALAVGGQRLLRCWPWLVTGLGVGVLAGDGGEIPDPSGESDLPVSGL